MMDADGLPFSKVISSEEGSKQHFHVPKYQREYKWSKSHWIQLVEDLNDNEEGYYVGSIIVVANPDRARFGGEEIYEVIDGQQRLTTLSLMMAAVYARLTEVKDRTKFDDDEDQEDFENARTGLRKKLVKKKTVESNSDSIPFGAWRERGKDCFLRVQPSSQNNNLNDYRFILSETGLIRPRKKPPRFGNRRFAKAFRYFTGSLPEKTSDLLRLVRRINQLYMVLIVVRSQADAFILFETLNNRGEPLSAIDIIKNKFLAEASKASDDEEKAIDAAFDQWQDLIKAVPDARTQERFLRHFYHANRRDPAVRVEGVSRVTRGKLIYTYETLIERSPQSILDRMCEAGTIYGNLVRAETAEFDDSICRTLEDIDHIQASPAYQLMLFLFSQPETSFEDTRTRPRCLELIRRFYVRRNATNFPGTSELDQGHIDLIDACGETIETSGRLTFDVFKNHLLQKGKYRTDDEFRLTLSGPIYDENAVLTRYLLVSLDRQYATREYAPDLSERNLKDRLVWTIEHVLPQTPNLPAHWIDMVSVGDAARASDIQEEHVDRIGNLTLSGYNSRLATASLSTKQTLTTKGTGSKKLSIGFKNKLALNALPFEHQGQSWSLGSVPTWNDETIESRTRVMVDELMQMFTFDTV